MYAFENVLFRFNSGSRQAGFSMGLASVGCGPDKIRNVQVIGNIGLRNSCTAGVTYRYNLYLELRHLRRDRPQHRGGRRDSLLRDDTDTPGPNSYRLDNPPPTVLVPAAIGCQKRTGSATCAAPTASAVPVRED